MLASLKDIMPALEQRRVCLPCFDIGGGQQDFLLGVLRACEAARSPSVMLLYGPAAENYMGLEACVEEVGFYARRAEVPVCLHLDHGQEEELVDRALRLGFRSVMFDSSASPLEENIERTRRMVELAHDYGATIEGELGQFGQEREEGEPGSGLTDPDQAARFVEETGVDVLAPAVGNAHGFYKEPPKLRFGLIEQTAARTGVPLSLHGGTGIPLEDVRRAGRLGMRKVNIASRLHRDFAETIREAAVGSGEKSFSWRRALQSGREAIGGRVSSYLSELDAEGLA